VSDVAESAGTTARVIGYRTPVVDEIDAVDLPVTGVIPPELAGRYVRNGPNPLPGEPAGHWFFAQGMLHGVRLRAGRAEWYRNRWVRTGRLTGRPPVRADGTRDLSVVSANTHVIEHAGRILALVESGFPHVVTPELDTVGPCDFGGRLTTGMTAHPKIDPVTGELHFFGYRVRPPYLTYHRLDAAGQLVHSQEIEVPAGTMMHDFAITQRYVLWLDLPVTFHPDLVGTRIPFQWDERYGARIGLMRRDRPGTDVQWFDVDPCYVFHVGNAYEDATGRVVLDVARYSAGDFRTFWDDLDPTTHPGGPPAAAAALGVARLHRWTLDPGTGRVTESRLDDRGVEFPTLDEDRVGRQGRHLYAVADLATSGRPAAAIVKYDTGSGGSESLEFGEDTAVGEAVFVPAGGARREDDGWLITIVTRRDGSASQMLVLDASAVARGPVARIDLPRGVPAGLHGSWIPDDDLRESPEKGARVGA
jgi:carotenoid cleavage dioxygenase-like enzyme